MKKTCYLFVFDGFADWETSPVTTGIVNSNIYQFKTIAISKDPVRSLSGLTVIPDLDFILENDLGDIDSDTTAILILPAENDRITPLIDHCFAMGIPVMNSSSRQEIFDILGIIEEFA